MSPSSVVIVGASLTAAKAAESLRSEGFDGSITMVGEDPERPYERPPLSKDYLQGKSERETVFVHSGELLPGSRHRPPHRHLGLLDRPCRARGRARGR